MENMLPWERDVYVAQLIGYIESENERLKLAQLEMKNKKSATPYG
tara:strand:- start:186 stop:320 length:135 start_codon:yes stop_codon:yes gene_type:complete